MSKGRMFSRPRTKVYDCNYNIGQNYYKSALDGLDRKYGRQSSSEPATNGGMSALRASLDRERESQKEAFERRAAARDLEDEEFFNDSPKRKPNAAALLGEFDSIFENRNKNGVSKEKESSRALRAFEDEADEEMSSSMKRIRAARAARAAAEDFDEIESNLSTKRTGGSARAKLDFSDKLIESVGISGKARAALEEEAVTGRQRRVLKITSSSVTEGEGGDITKWTALKSGSGRRHIADEEDDESAASLAAAARARKSRARLEDLEAEMQALSDRGAAREKRVRDLKALVHENESNTKEQIHSAVRVKSTIQSEKKVVSF